MLRLRKAERAARAVGFAVCIALIGVLEWGIQLRHNEQLAQQRLLALSFASSLRANIDRELNSLFTLTASLSSYLEIRVKNDRIDDAEVNALLANLYRKSRHVLNFGLAIGYRLTYVYPLQGNEKAVGLYYPDVPDQWPSVQQSIINTKGTLAGPVSLVQGGQGLIYRVPVFIEGRYWGLLSTVIDAPDLLKDVMRSDMPGQFEFAVRGRDGKGGNGEVFWGDSKLFDAADSVLMRADIPGGHWLYAVRISTTTPQYFIVVQHVFAWMLSGLLGFFAYQLQKQRSELAMVARTDPLTHVTNRRAFEMILEGALTRNRKYNQNAFVILFLDLNRFKLINDNYGHEVGDVVLATIAQRLRMVLRDDDVIGRWGGDEFVVLLRYSSSDAVAHVTARIREVFTRPVIFESVEHSVGVAIGMATYPEDGDNIAALVRVADERMYHEKYGKT